MNTLKYKSYVKKLCLQWWFLIESHQQISVLEKLMQYIGNVIMHFDVNFTKSD